MTAAIERAREVLRSGSWVTVERIRLVAVVLLIASTAGFLFLVVTAHGGVDLQHRPLGTDFSNVYAAGTYVDEGHAEAPFDPVRQFARERSIFGGDTQFYGWHYPPYFLFVAALLALMPYGLALAIWQTVTLGLYLWVIRAIIFSRSRLQGEDRDEAAFPPGSRSRTDPRLRIASRFDRAPPPARGDHLWLLLALAFPAVLINVGHGQNGFLTAALLGGALVLLDRRPLIAGVLFGLLIYKPQYGLMLPVALAASGRWRCFVAAAATVVIVTLATTLVFGASIWHAFAVFAAFTRTVVLEQGDTGWHKIQSVFSWARMWGAPIPLAYTLQGIVSTAVGVALAWLWRGTAAFALKAAALCLAAILATPYSFDYDMMVLAPAIAFFFVDATARGFGPWEKSAMAALWLVPLVARTVAQVSFIPLGVPVMLSVFLLILQRAQNSRTRPTMNFSARPAMVAESTGGTRAATTSPR